MLETITAPSRQAARWRESGVPPASLTALIKIAVNLPKESTVQQLRTQSSRHVWLPYVAVFVLALGLRLTYEAFVWNGPLGNADSAAYEDLAVKILRHQPYQTNQSAGPGGFPSDLQRPPGYPVFLAAVNIHAATANAMSKHRSSLAQCILGAAFATVLAWLAATLTSPWIGILAGCFYAADWVTIVHTPMVLSETVFAVVLGSAVLIYALALSQNRHSLYLTAGVFLGLAALVKPAAQVVVVAFLIAWACRKPLRLSGLLFLATYLACVLPWMVRNETKYGVFTLSQLGTATVYFYSAEGSLHVYPLQDLAGTRITADVDNLDREWRAQPLTPKERTRRMTDEAARIIASHPLAVVRQATIGFVRTSLGTASVTAANSLNAPPGRVVRVLLNVLPFIQNCMLWALAIFACFTAVFLRLEIRVLLVASVLCILAPAASPLAHSRFRVPAMPEICVLAAAGVAVVAARSSRWKCKLQSRRAPTATTIEP